jgi:hypothetical protein
MKTINTNCFKEDQKKLFTSLANCPDTANDIDQSDHIAEAIRFQFLCNGIDLSSPDSKCYRVDRDGNKLSYYSISAIGAEKYIISVNYDGQSKLPPLSLTYLSGLK